MPTARPSRLTVAFWPLAALALLASAKRYGMLLFARALTRTRKWLGIRGKFTRAVQHLNRADALKRAVHFNVRLQMTSHDIFLDRIEPNGIVVATNNAEEVPTGTVFSHLVKTRYEGVPGHGKLIDLWSAPISLRLSEVYIFRKLVPAIPRGWSAGLVLEGSGIDEVEVAIREKQKGEFFHLRGTNAA